MKKYFLILLVLSIPGFLWSQENVDLNMVHRIRQEGLNHSGIEDITFHLTDASGSRLTNSPGFKRAADWTISQLTAWGLKNAALEPWGDFGKGWEVKKCYAAMTSPYYVPFICIPKAWTGGTGGLVSGAVMLIEINSEEDFKNYEGKLDGKIVLIKSRSQMQPGFEADADRLTDEELNELAKKPLGGRGRYTPEFLAQVRSRRQFSRMIDEFLSEQNVSLVIRGATGKDGTFFTGGGADYKMEAKTAGPEIEMAPENANLVTRLIENGIEVKVEAEVQTQFYESDPDAYNVIAEIPGTDKNLKSELVMMGGHLDSWHTATGATDDAAGCIVMMEAVRILMALVVQPRRTIRIALWSAEEQGIYGSRYYVKNHFADQADMKVKPEHSRLSVYFNVDNGTGRIRGIYLQGNDMARPIFQKWFEPFEDMIDNTTISIRNTGGTDHLSFDAVGLPGFQFIQDPLDYDTRTHHSNMDTRERLVVDDLRQMAVMVASFVYNAAQRDEKLPRKPLPEPRAANEY
ncbi:MAG TPA: M20/M25/M40 family metallo-hydrolase [Cyclobacteriaceae bacterium]|nr:M20/M25/M40 family metallo-hydrolase [Cyclobacteriaceae bacterium]